MRISLIFPGVVALVCIFPFLLTLMGVDFSSQLILVPDGVGNQDIDAYFHRLSGAFTHTLLEWSAFVIAVCVAVLAFVHYRVVNDVTVLVIGIVLLASGCMDAFHTLVADRLIEGGVDNSQLNPFTWAIARIFGVIILTVGVGFLCKPSIQSEKKHFKRLLAVCAVAIGLACGLMYYCSIADSLPRALYPDSLISRPWDIVPLILILLVSLFLLPRYYRGHPSLFSLALLVSMIPYAILELHMAFGSSSLFDSHFNIAHGLKIIAHLVPFIAIVMDYSFSHQKQTDLIKTLTNTKAYVEAIIDSSVDGVITINQFGIIKSVNSMIVSQFGYKAEELIGQDIKMLLPEAYQAYLDSYLSNYTESEEDTLEFAWELIGQSKDGNVFTMELTFVEIKDNGESMITGFVRDISKCKQFEEQLKEREELFSTFVNSAPVLMWMSDADDKLVMFNDGWLAFFGTDLQDEIEKPWEGLSIHEDFRDFCQNNYQTKMAAQESFEQEYKMCDKSGQYFWFREMAVPRFHNGEFQGYISNLIDITDRKIVEEGLRDSMENLKKSNEELEQFAYVASHDLQEPLRMVASYTQLLSRRYKGRLDADADEFIEYAADGAKRMQGLIQALLEYSRVGSLGKPLSLIDSGEVLKNAIANISVALDEAGVQLTFDRMPKVMADEHQLLQLLQNLISNAIKYSDPQKLGEIHIATKLDGNDWTISVKDNGIGIDPEYFNRIFIIFKRLHTRHEKSGTGIGLSICKKIVERHGGKIWVESVPGEGSTFFFTLQSKEEVLNGNNIVSNEVLDGVLNTDELFVE